MYLVSNRYPNVLNIYSQEAIIPSDRPSLIPSRELPTINTTCPTIGSYRIGIVQTYSSNACRGNLQNFQNVQLSGVRFGGRGKM
jgi:hypothetical protein